MTVRQNFDHLQSQDSRQVKCDDIYCLKKVKIFGVDSRYFQGMGCEGACAHASVRCAVARVRVRAKILLNHVCEVCARDHF